MTLKGSPASEGIGLGRAIVIRESDSEISNTQVTDINTELNRFLAAVERAKEEIKEIKETAQRNLGEKNAMIFDAHLLILEDPELLNMVKENISKGMNAESALDESAKFFETILSSLEDEYMRERANDIRDVTSRVIKILSHKEEIDLKSIPSCSIVVARELTPSQTAQMNKQNVRGFVTEKGGKTSHTAIIARTYEIPAVVGIGDITSLVRDGDFLIIDGNDGTVYVNPDESLIREYEKRLEEETRKKEELRKFLQIEARTQDSRRIKLVANIAHVDETDVALKNGAEGVGLFRTEFLFMDRTEPPSEEEQFEAYKTVLEKMGERPVIIRTLDIGGDKSIPYLNIPKEENPFLGCRAIRLCLAQQDLFKVQLRALLRASVYGNLKIMFPMISCIDEIIQTKEIMKEVKTELDKEGIKYSEDFEIGIMVETPSAAIISDMLAEEVDFFSIGSNDLIQYTLVIDRTNDKVSYLYNPLHPAVLRLIKLTVDNAHKKGIEVGVCGEIASDLNMVPILIGLGVDELSVSPSKVLNVKKKIFETNSEREKVTIQKLIGTI
ncbi:MAG TPA: phosphoenolpyruvate--protein phosphotransferase [Fervidobacterium sp.]|nr:phosphoenolpyruvate--protein phosphotransferase [Fervidobacterium sp.]HOK33124.1 phosphoenolpyruvate--protein phosphotransferase [Fervidobacterium sp.]HOL03702.1 phosphoenolpyruvate--protein phosphotransferase [Fervidobacterium sp.]HON03708.1 phosphoenolpyruvate--protein phosphotransferase [Fervidobacterium sp.]HQI08739.1 phosphoenolpyruvate--protein phosphotransferase [Fervidobacterium sp.]